MRQLYLAEYLMKCGYTVNICGVDRSRVPGESLRRVRGAIHPYEMAVPGSGVVVLPIPVSRDGFHISTPLAGSRISYEIGDILDIADSDAVLAGGYVSDYIRAHIEERHMKLIDYNASEIFQIRNSVPTAEGALEIAMRELPVTVRGATAAVLGYGRCGKALASRLRSVGADVIVSARSERALAWAEIEGCRTSLLSSFVDIAGECDVIFNTIPYPVVTEEILLAMQPDSLFIDITSLPGGIVSGAKIPDGITTIYAGGLPGKTSPKTAGETVGMSVLKTLAEMGVEI